MQFPERGRQWRSFHRRQQPRRYKNSSFIKDLLLGNISILYSYENSFSKFHRNVHRIQLAIHKNSKYGFAMEVLCEVCFAQFLFCYIMFCEQLFCVYNVFAGSFCTLLRSFKFLLIILILFFFYFTIVLHFKLLTCTVIHFKLLTSYLL